MAAQELVLNLTPTLHQGTCRILPSFLRRNGSNYILPWIFNASATPQFTFGLLGIPSINAIGLLAWQYPNFSSLKCMVTRPGLLYSINSFKDSIITLAVFFDAHACWASQFATGIYQTHGLVRMKRSNNKRWQLENTQIHLAFSLLSVNNNYANFIIWLMKVCQWVAPASLGTGFAPCAKAEKTESVTWVRVHKLSIWTPSRTRVVQVL